MPKHWGLQYQKRMEDYTKKFVSTRCYLEELTRNVRVAEREVISAKSAESNGMGEHAVNERALANLMRIGPKGLAAAEGETGPEFSISEFLEYLDKNPHCRS